ncbi:MAG TPA: hypothetical protein DE179_01325 [Oceanospirillaceae bacterium]|nr:hypothetical protein [Oceanospirillaceae bacterium]
MEFEEYEKRLENAGQYGAEIFLVVLAYLSMLLSALLSMLSGDELWFSRSGSLAVIFCAIAEYRNITVQQGMNEVAQDSTSRWDATPEKWVVPASRKKFEKFVLFSIILATVVWGYGDLLFKNS